MQPYLAMIVPVSGQPDNSLPPSHGGHPGNRPPGSWGGPIDPGWGSGGIDHVGGGPIFHPGHPDHGLPSRPDHIGGGPIYHPGHPDHGLPSGPPEHAWWGGRDPNRPNQGLPGGGAEPKSSLHAGVTESNIPSHPQTPDTENGEWVLVALGDRKMAWAWMSPAAPVPEPKA